MLIWRRIKTRSFFNNWINIRENEGVSQRVQEDTIRVVKLVESLYFKIVMSVIRAVTHIPVIIHLSKEVGGIPLFPPDSKYSLIIYMILSLFVSVFLVYLTSKDLSFKIVEKEIKEASFRKKLIIEEDQEFLFNTFSMSSILDDITLIHKEIYLYLFKYDLTSGFLREIIQFLPTILLVPSIIKGSISIGSRAVIIRCFDTVRTGITCIIFNWDEISELIAAAKRISLLESSLLKHKPNQNKDENEHKIPLLA